MFDTLFAFFHIFLLLGVLAYAVFSLLEGNILRFSVIMAGLVGYYFLVLHKNVRKEIQRKQKNR